MLIPPKKEYTVESSWNGTTVKFTLADGPSDMAEALIAASKEVCRIFQIENDGESLTWRPPMDVREVWI